MSPFYARRSTGGVDTCDPNTRVREMRQLLSGTDVPHEPLYWPVAGPWNSNSEDPYAEAKLSSRQEGPGIEDPSKPLCESGIRWTPRASV